MLDTKRLRSKFVSSFIYLALSLPAMAAVDFAVSTLDTGISVSQSVYHAYLRNPDRADLIVMTITEDRARRVRIYELGDDLKYRLDPVVDFPLPEDVVLVETGRLGGRDALVFFTADRAIQYDPFEDTVRPLVSFRSVYNVPQKEGLTNQNQLRDMNDDKLDDFVIPGFEGYTLFLQQPNGSFGPALLMKAPPVMQIFNDDNVLYRPRLLFHTDLNLDGRKDVAFWLEDKFIVYPQSANGTFSGDAFTLTSNVPFQFDGIGGVSFRMGEEDQSDLTLKALYELRDLNADKLPDLVTLTVESKGVFKKQTTYAFHNGKRARDGGVTFALEPSSQIKSNGIQFKMEHKDLNRDGQEDVVVSSVQLGVTKIIGALLTGSIDIDLNFYQMKDGVYPAEPNASREITASFNLSSGDVFFPFVLIADVNGDEFADLLVQDGTDTIKVYEGEAGARLFARRPLEIKVELPNDAELVTLADVNNDGKQDIVMRLQKKNKANRVTVLVAR